MADPDIEIAEQTANGWAAGIETGVPEPGLALMDVSMSGLNGIERGI